MNEIWKDIEDYEGIYQISNIGRVKSLKRYTNNQFGKTDKILKPAKNRGGYLYVVLSKDNKRKLVKIHRLVAQAFLPNPRNLPETNHLKGIKTDNRVSQLEWVTRSENEKHAFRIGLKSNSGDRHPFNKLNSKQIRIIKWLMIINPKLTQEWVGNMFGVTKNTISNIKLGITWQYVKI